MTDLDPRLHFVAITTIIEKDGKFLIAKRSETEKAFPGKWTVPGGKLVLSEYDQLPKTSEDHPQWYNVVEWVLRKEVREEVGVEVGKPQYLCDLVFVRPDGYPALVLSYWAKWESGDVELCKDLIDHAWVTPEEAKGYDMIDGIAEEIEQVAKLIS